VSARRRTVAGCLLVITIGAATSGCQFLGMVRQRRAMRAAFASEPRLALQRALAPEDCFSVTGRVAGAEAHDEPLLVVAIGHRFATDEVVTTKPVAHRVELYNVLLPEGDYDLLVLADLDRGGVFESTELVGRTDPSALVRVGPAASRDGFLIDGPTMRVDPTRPGATSVPIRVELARTHNVVPSLADDFYALRWASAAPRTTRCSP
jgi:hypothetical protein